MRGVHSHHNGSGHCQSGSSPHARGPPSGTDFRHLPLRIIPACAGSTSRDDAISYLFKDHPRMRGVHHVINGGLQISVGSSPHARGPLKYEHQGSNRSWDHPRMRGVHFFVNPFFLSHSGSSPHARGPLMPFGTSRKDPGIIPACAGSTVIAIRIALRRKDHPRMRGVHQMGHLIISQSTGSSPHARGPLALREFLP